jgi:regulator of nucleoside diphosphate kinase
MEATNWRGALMKDDKVLITRENMERLRCLDSWKSARDRDRAYLQILAQKLDFAQVVTSDRIPHDVVTMNSQVCVNHLDGGHVKIYTLVFPGSAEVSKGNVSVLAPIGTALLGHCAGALIDCDVPSGRKRFRIEEIVYQPEAAARTAELDANRVDHTSYYPAA